jgi:hypothetical protein
LYEPIERDTELIATVAAQRSQGVAGEAFRMQARDDLARAEHIAMNERDVLFAVAIVPKCHDLKPAGTRRQVSHGLDLHANAVLAEAFAVMIFVAKDEIPEARNTGQAGDARNAIGSFLHDKAALQGMGTTSSQAPSFRRSSSIHGP